MDQQNVAVIQSWFDMQVQEYGNYTPGLLWKMWS